MSDEGVEKKNTAATTTSIAVPQPAVAVSELLSSVLALASISASSSSSASPLTSKPAASFRRLTVLHDKKSPHHAVNQAIALLQWKPLLLSNCSAPTSKDAGDDSAAASAPSTVPDPPAALLRSFDLTWLDVLPSSFYSSLLPHQKLNQFPGIEQVTRKQLLAKNLNEAKRRIEVRRRKEEMRRSLKGRKERSRETKGLAEKEVEKECKETKAAESTDDLLDRLSQVSFDFYPRSFVLPADWSALTQYHAERVAASTADSPPVLIVKPDSSCEGRGIYLTTELLQSTGESDGPTSPNAATSSADASSTSASFSPAITSTTQAVVQSYLPRPFLIHQRKFDLRLYLLITSLSPLRVYIYDEGLVRFCSQPYEPPMLGQLGKPEQHLTNYAVNKGKEQSKRHDDAKQSREETAEEEGPAETADPLLKWSLSDWKSYMSRHHPSIFLPDLFARIEAQLLLPILTILPTLRHAYSSAFPLSSSSASSSSPSPSHCYQLLGCDILLDADGRSWLIEMNRNPSMRCEMEVDRRVKVKMVADMWRMMVQPAERTAQTSGRELSREEKEARRKLSAKEARELDRKTREEQARKAHEQEEQVSSTTLWKRIYPVRESYNSNHAEAKCDDWMLNFAERQRVFDGIVELMLESKGARTSSNKSALAR